MSEKPERIDHWLRQYLDEPCEQIIDVMMIYDVYKPDPRRYNELYRLVKSALKSISKPTFNDHMKHLLEKRLVKRDEKGKQIVQLYLNEDHPMMKIGHQTASEVKKEVAVLQRFMKDPKFWDRFPAYIGSYFAYCELRKWRLMLNNVLSSGRDAENLLALTFQMKQEDDLRHLAIRQLERAMNCLESVEEKEKLQRRLLKCLDEAIKEYAEDMDKAALQLQAIPK